MDVGMDFRAAKILSAYACPTRVDYASGVRDVRLDDAPRLSVGGVCAVADRPARGVGGSGAVLDSVLGAVSRACADTCGFHRGRTQAVSLVVSPFPRSRHNQQQTLSIVGLVAVCVGGGISAESSKNIESSPGTSGDTHPRSMVAQGSRSDHPGGGIRISPDLWIICGGLVEGDHPGRLRHGRASQGIAFGNACGCFSCGWMDHVSHAKDDTAYLSAIGRVGRSRSADLRSIPGSAFLLATFSKVARRLLRCDLPAGWRDVRTCSRRLVSQAAEDGWNACGVGRPRRCKVDRQHAADLRDALSRSSISIQRDRATAASRNLTKALTGVLAVLILTLSGCVITGTAGVSHSSRTPAGITSAGAAMEFSK